MFCCLRYGPKEDKSGVIRATISHHMNLEYTQVRPVPCTHTHMHNGVRFPLLPAATPCRLVSSCVQQR